LTTAQKKQLAKLHKVRNNPEKISRTMKAKWQDPEFREHAMAATRAGIEAIGQDEFRRRVSEGVKKSIRRRMASCS
jgi:hypothetical protein